MRTPTPDSRTCNILNSTNPSHMTVITKDLETKLLINSASRAQLLFSYSQHRAEFSQNPRMKTSYPLKHLDFSTCCIYIHKWTAELYTTPTKCLQSSQRTPNPAGSYFLGLLRNSASLALREELQQSPAQGRFALLHQSTELSILNWLEEHG